MSAAAFRTAVGVYCAAAALQIVVFLADRDINHLIIALLFAVLVGNAFTIRNYQRTLRDLRPAPITVGALWSSPAPGADTLRAGVGRLGLDEHEPGSGPSRSGGAR